MIPCNMCFCDIQKDQVKMGCVKKVKSYQCPQCKQALTKDYNDLLKRYNDLLKQYTWVNMWYTDKRLKYFNLMDECYNLKCKNESDKRQSKVDTFILQKQLDESIDLVCSLKEQIRQYQEDEKMTSDLEDVIKKYNLNLI